MATPVFACGFECGQLGSVGQHWGTATGVSINTVAGKVRTGNRSLRINVNGTTAFVSPVNGLSASAFAGRVYLWFDDLPDNSAALFYVVVGSDNYGAVFNAGDSSIRAQGVALGASGVVVTTGQWYRIDVRVNLQGNPHLTDVQVNGVACAQASWAAAATTFSAVRLGLNSSGTADVYYDDFIMSQTLADYPFGAGYVNHFVPTADGTHNVAGASDFERGTTGTDIINTTTDSYLLVDEVPLDDTTPDTDDFINCKAPPNATDYVEHVFGPAPGVSTPTTAPRAVEVIVAHHQASTAVGVSAFKLNDNGTESTILALNGAGATTTRYHTKQYVTSPTGGPWTVVSGNGNFNNLRHRFGYSSDALPDQYFDCVMIEAEFVEDTFDAATLPPPAIGLPELTGYGIAGY